MTPNRCTFKCWLRFKGISQAQTDQLLRECVAELSNQDQEKRQTVRPECVSSLGRRENV